MAITTDPRRFAGCDEAAGQRTDEELLLAYRDRGDRQAFDELVYRYEAELYNYLRNYLGDAQMAEDAFQNTFLQVHLKCGQFEQGRRVRPWLYAVAVNQAIDAHRRNRRHRLLSLDRRAGNDQAWDHSAAMTDVLYRVEIDPAETFASAEDGATLRQAVHRLPEGLRQAVLLVYYQGLRYREAAEVLGVPVGTIKSRLHAAIQRLSAMLSSMRVSGNE